MDFLDPYVVSSRRALVPAEEVRALDVPVPSDYERAVTLLGAGGWCHEVGLRPPAQVRSELDRWREMWSEYWFWDGEVVSQDQVVAGGVLVGDSYNGDALVFVDGRVVILPRDEDLVVDAGATCGEAVAAVFESGLVGTRPTFPWFVAAGEMAYQNRSGGDFDGLRDVVRDAFPDALEDQDPGQRVTTFLVPEFGGFVRIHDHGWVGSHVQLEPELQPAFTELDAALAAAGNEVTGSW